MNRLDQRIVIDELVFEVDGAADARAHALASRTAEALAECLRQLQERRLAQDAHAPAIHIERLRVPLPQDPSSWPSASQLADHLAVRVTGEIEGGRP